MFSSLIGNPRLSGYLEHHHPEILTGFKATCRSDIVGGKRLVGSEQPAFLD
jgi:hypothetical protein